MTTARQSMSMMKRLQMVRGSSDSTRAGGVGADGGEAASSVARSARGALEVEIVIPDFSVGRAAARGARRAHDADDDRLGLRRGRELKRDLLPVVRARRDGLRRRQYLRLGRGA